ncbi:MAG: PAS domain S-box protein [Desulfatirhabdiaceae bacterium]
MPNFTSAIHEPKKPHLILVELLSITTDSRCPDIEPERLGSNFYWGIRRNITLKLHDIKFFQELAETGDDLFCWMDNKGHFRYVSPSAEMILGIEPDLCVDRKAMDFIYKEDRRHTMDIIKKCVEKNIRSTSIENRIVHTKGETRHLMWTVNLKFDQRGALVRINAIGKDITERKQADSPFAQFLST